MKIAFLVGALPFGGIESQLLDICKALLAAGHAPCVVNISGEGMKHKDYIASGIETIALFHDRSYLKTFKPKTFFKLRETLGRTRPDIVHTQHFSADYYGRLAAIGLGIPVVTHIHNTKIERHAHRRAANRLLSYATDMFLCVSKAVAAMAAKEHNLARRRMEVLYNCIDPGQFDCPPLDCRAAFGLSGRIVVAVGRLINEQKNFDKLVAGFALAAPSHPDARLLIVGEGKDRPVLEGLIREHGLEGKAVLAGYRDDVPAILKSCHVFAMPSAFEGLPISHLEAMQCGLPAVVSANVPSLEIAERACLVCDTTPRGIADKLDAVLSDEEGHERMRRAALEIAAGHHVNRYVASLVDIYSSLCSGKAG